MSNVCWSGISAVPYDELVFNLSVFSKVQQKAGPTSCGCKKQAIKLPHRHERPVCSILNFETKHPLFLGGGESILAEPSAVISGETFIRKKQTNLL